MTSGGFLLGLSVVAVSMLGGFTTSALFANLRLIKREVQEILGGGRRS
jgi:hypothetical protein